MLSFLSIIAADITSISNAFKEGKASLLLNSMAPEVNVSIPGISMKSDPDKAVSSLTNFFKNNKAIVFRLLHHADKQKDALILGSLDTSSGQYRVIIIYRLVNDKAIIQSIKIE